MPEKNVGMKNSSAAAGERAEARIRNRDRKILQRHAGQRQHRQGGERSEREQHAQFRQPGFALRIAAAGEIAQRQRQHEDRDQRAPHIDAAAEVRRQQPAAEQLDAHHEEARPERDEVAEHHARPEIRCVGFMAAVSCWTRPERRPWCVLAGRRKLAASSARDRAGAPRPPPTARRHRPTSRIRPSAQGAARGAVRSPRASTTASSCARSAARDSTGSALLAGMRAQLALAGPRCESSGRCLPRWPCGPRLRCAPADAGDPSGTPVRRAD